MPIPLTANGSFTETIVAVLRDHQYLADPLVFILGFAEGVPVVSLFVPSSALFLAVGSMQGAFGGSFISLWLSATAGAIVYRWRKVLYEERFGEGRNCYGVDAD